MPTRCEPAAIGRSTRPTKCASRTSTRCFGFDQLDDAADRRRAISCSAMRATCRSSTCVRRHRPRSMAVSGESRQSCRARHLPARSEFVGGWNAKSTIDGPTMLAIHLTLSHWPYNWAGIPTPTTPQQYRPAYRAGDRGGRPPVRRRSCDVLEAQGYPRQCDRRRALGSWRGARRRERLDAPQDRHQPRNLGLALGPRHERDEPTPVPRPASPCARMAARRLPGPAVNHDWPVSSKTCGRHSRSS